MDEQKQTDANRGPSPASSGPRSIGFACVSVLLIFHLAAIVTSPSTIPPSSQVQRDSYLLFGTYLETFYLNHGWHYFAPDPGPSTLLKYRGEDPDGNIVEGTLPDKTLLKPRLRYHRYFMLTEALPRMADADPQLRAEYYQSLADGIGKLRDIDTIELWQVTHELPTRQAIRAGFAVNDPDFYETERLGRFTCRR